MTGQLGATVAQLFRLCDQMRADGASSEAIATYTEGVLRTTWPHRRPWSFVCEGCADVGLVLYRCEGDASCGRVPGHGAHTFGRPCSCDRGRPFRPKPQDDVTVAGKRPRSLTRVGR